MNNQTTYRDWPPVTKYEIPSKCHLLELPFDIRRRIYYAVGLGPNLSTDMNFYGILWKRENLGELYGQEMSESNQIDDQDGVEAKNSGRFARVDRNLQPLPLNLLYVCRTMHDEVEKLLYGENHFFITRRDPGGLGALLNLSLTATRHLSQLTIRVNIESCIGMCCSDGYSCGNHRQMNGWTHVHDTPLSCISDEEKDIVSQWQQICTLLSKIPANQLALYVICDCQDLETAEIIVDALSSMPRLYDFALRLAFNYQKKLQHLATTAVFSLVGHLRVPSAPFRFLDLSKEIQLHILSYTSLVPKPDFSSEWGGPYVRYYDEKFCRFNNFNDCNGIASTSRPPEDEGYSGGWLGACIPQCFCTVAHSAFTFKCKCEDDVSKYFFVSRQFKELSELVYYASNRFRITRDGVVPEDIGTQSEEQAKVAVLPFMNWFRNDSFNRVTFLQLNFDKLEPGSDLLSPIGWKQWLNTIEIIRKHPRLPTLTIEVRMDEPFGLGSGNYHIYILNRISRKYNLSVINA